MVARRNRIEAQLEPEYLSVGVFEHIVVRAEEVGGTGEDGVQDLGLLIRIVRIVMSDAIAQLRGGAEIEARREGT